MAESRSTAVERCTSILLHAFMDYLCLPDILRGMGVNRCWREHAINHPRYYGELRMFQCYPPGYADFLLLRLSRSNGRPVSLLLELGDPNPPRLIEAIADHLDHLTFLTVRQSPEQSIAPILNALYRPAPLLRRLDLQYRPKSIRAGESMPTVMHPTWQPAVMFSSEFLGGHAPALTALFLSDIDLPPDLPRCLANLRTLSFSGHGLDHGRELVLPNPFARCPDLRVLHLSGHVTLDPVACQDRAGWKRLEELSFLSSGLGDVWQNFDLPLADIQSIDVTGARDAATAAALVDTVSGALEVSFEPLQRIPVPAAAAMNVPWLAQAQELVIYRAAVRSAADPRVVRTMMGYLSVSESAAVFGTPSLADRVARLVLPLAGWEDFVGFAAFGPFGALEELVLTLSPDDDFHTLPTTRLSCPRLKRFVLKKARRGCMYRIAVSDSEMLVVDTDLVSAFVLAALLGAALPVELLLADVGLSRSHEDFPKTFSSCVSREREHRK